MSTSSENRKNLTDQEFTQKRALWPFLKRIFKYSQHHRFWFTALIVFTLLSALTEALFPLVWLYFIDDFIRPAVENYKTGQPLPWSGFYQYAGYYVLLLISWAVNTGMFIFATGRVKHEVVYDLRKDMFDRLQYLSYAFFDKVASGWITIRLTSDVNKVADVISWGFISLVYGLVMITASLWIMFVYSWQLTLVVLLTIPLLMFTAVRIRMILLTHARKARKLYSEMAANLTENINGVEVNKATVQEQRAARFFQGISGRLRDSSYQAGYYTAMYGPVVVTVGSLAAAAVIYQGGHMVLEAETGITVGILAAFFSYALTIFEPIFDITNYYATAQDSLSAGERIFSLIDEPIQIKDREGVTDFGKIRGDIRFDQVEFYYAKDKPVIPNLNLEIKAGQSIALVGPTGEGKSTIINLICRFYEPIQGRILIDGQDYQDRTLKSFREQLGIILQTPHLFSGTVQENLRYGKLDATQEEIENALRLIGADDFIPRLQEDVGEEGSQLSLGERQLLSLARAILKDPRILIMDEATSSVDTLTEAKIQKGIEQLIQERTSIIIAHRLSTIKNCDRILVIRQGQIIEDGSHAELMKKQGAYYQLYTRQLREEAV